MKTAPTCLVILALLSLLVIAGCKQGWSCPITGISGSGGGVSCAKSWRCSGKEYTVTCVEKAHQAEYLNAIKTGEAMVARASTKGAIHVCTCKDSKTDKEKSFEAAGACDRGETVDEDIDLGDKLAKKINQACGWKVPEDFRSLSGASTAIEEAKRHRK